ncbi:A/G-specific adenine glycosylase [Candidatus Woesearchaeota archaeon]|nr:A/G-specific adenine glycosylase [Candidatus Woesearchaeota archaeon]
MDTKTFQERILTHYEKQGRDLPWRKTTDRYHILISEVMLQQTQVDRVIPKYEAWLKAFPTVSALAGAPLAKALQLWSGLGYNNRAKRLHDAANSIMEQHEGIVPGTVKALQALPGIGPYTARSILIFADNQDLATVDTNIRRILIHELNLPGTISDKELFRKAEEVLPKGRSRDWHNALMDYGAAILTSKATGIKPKTTQPAFKGSKRYYRGRIIKHLTEHETITPDQAAERFPCREHDLKGILEELEAEGLIENDKGVYALKG